VLTVGGHMVDAPALRHAEAVLRRAGEHVFERSGGPSAGRTVEEDGERP
jgi:hypothetical protein